MSLNDWLCLVVGANALAQILGLRLAPRSDRWQWLGRSLIVLAVLAAAGHWRPHQAGYWAALPWLLLLVLPVLGSHIANWCTIRRRYQTAARATQWFMAPWPAPSWRTHAAILHALAAAQRGDSLDLPGNGAAHLAPYLQALRFRLSGDWAGLAAWFTELPAATRQAGFLQLLQLRALGELGRSSEMAQQFRQLTARRQPPDIVQWARVFVLAFSGRTEAVAAALTLLPGRSETEQALWLATAESSAGAGAAAQARLAAVPPPTDQLLARELSRRRQMPPAVAVLTAAEQQLVAATAAQVVADARLHVPLFCNCRAAPSTWLLLLLNVAVFGWLAATGETMDSAHLLDCGAVHTGLVAAGEWWRIGSAMFLHFGPLHLVMNLVALLYFGLQLEQLIGSRRWLLLYLLAGIGSMLTVTVWHLTQAEYHVLVVGASGSIMGLAGGATALYLRGWLGHGSQLARRQCAIFVLVIVLQSICDWLLPALSMMAHSSGAAIGFCFGLSLTVRGRSRPRRGLALPVDGAAGPPYIRDPRDSENERQRDHEISDV